MNTQPYVFRQNQWFQSLLKADSEALLKHAKPLKISAGEILYQQGDSTNVHSSGFFGLLSGVIKISFLHANGSEGILTFIEPGNWFGEVSMLADLPRPQMAIAQQDCELLNINHKQFSDLMLGAGFASSVAQLVANRLCMMYRLMEDATLSSTHDRICRRLLMLSHGDISQSQQARQIISASQESMANMLGISRPTLNKALQKLARTGAIALHYGFIEILDSSQLNTQNDG